MSDINLFDVYEWITAEQGIITEPLRRLFVFSVLKRDGRMAGKPIQVSKQYIRERLGVSRDLQQSACKEARKAGLWKEVQQKAKYNRQAPTEFEIDWKFIKEQTAEFLKKPVLLGAGSVVSGSAEKNRKVASNRTGAGSAEQNEKSKEEEQYLTSSLLQNKEVPGFSEDRKRPTQNHSVNEIRRPEGTVKRGAIPNIPGLQERMEADAWERGER